MSINELKEYVTFQVYNIFKYNIEIELDLLEEAIEKTELALSKRNSKYNFDANPNNISFSVYNSTHYTIFLYFLSNVLFKKDTNGLRAEKIYYLNKVLNGVDIFYEVSMPNVFGVEHPLASVIGKAKMLDYLFIYQGCTIGGSGGYYPQLGERVIMYSNSKILGNSTIGNNVIISANTYIINQNVPNNSIVFGSSPNLIIKTYSEEYVRNKCKHIWK